VSSYADDIEVPSFQQREVWQPRFGLGPPREAAFCQSLRRNGRPRICSLMQDRHNQGESTHGP
jgi:hypothetical protein